MTRRSALPALALFGLALAAPVPARAVYQCGPQTDDCQCGANNPYPCCDNGGNCTWWAWEAACCNWGIGLPGWGNANQWAGNARANGGYRVEGWPVVGAVSCRASGQYGHVAFVIALNGGGVRVSEQNCWGNYGMREWDYSNSGWWDGGFITPNGRIECSPGDSQTQACGQCGSQGRGCGNDGRWGGWGGCGGDGPCVPGESQEQGCGACGKQKRSCGGDCQWGAWDACAGELECPAGTTESQACGNCGKRERVCSASCAWGELGACAGEGACAAGDVEEVPCKDCGTQARTCGDDCQWGELGECVSAPADAGEPRPCQTGKPGACAPGVRQCAAGIMVCIPFSEPTEESCNGVDDDCDGATDEDLGCPDAGTAVPRRDAGSAHLPPGTSIAAGCGCAGSGAAGAAPLSLVALLVALGARRRRGSGAL